MAYMRLLPPSIEEMTEQFTDWMARHAQAKATVRFDYRDGTYCVTEIDHRGPTPKAEVPNVKVTGSP